MNGLASTYFVVNSELARGRSTALRRAALAWDPELEDAPSLIDARCESGDFDDAA